MRTSYAVCTSLALAVVSMSGEAFGQNIDRTFYHRLNTEFLGSGMSLDVINGGPQNNRPRLERTQDVTGQYWRFTGVEGGYYRLSTMFRGRQMCLDVFNGGADNNQLHLTRCQNVSGQLWKVRADGPWLRLTTQFRGDGACLDVFNGGANDRQPHLTGCANLSGQHWTVSKTDKRVEGSVIID